LVRLAPLSSVGQAGAAQLGAAQVGAIQGGAPQHGAAQVRAYQVWAYRRYGTTPRIPRGDALLEYLDFLLVGQAALFRFVRLP